jgi:outer membrane protein assembly factor BamB
MHRNFLKFGIISLLILSIVAPMSLGYDFKTTPSESKVIDDTDFYFYNEYGSSKADYYREYLEKDYSDGDVEPDEQSFSMESLEQILSDGPMDSAWPMKCHDNRHTSQSPYSTADNPGTEKWRFHFSGWLEDTPVIDNDGVIYCKGAYEYLDRYIFAINPDGTEKWKFKTDGLILGASPAIAEDGTIFFCSWDSNLYAMYPNGTLKWKCGIGSNIASSPAIANDGTIYLGQMSPGYSIVAVNPNGTIKWKYKTGSWISSDPAIGDDGTIYIGSSDFYFYAMWPNGTLRWRFKTGDYIKGPPSIADNGIIYIGSFDEHLYALLPNGTMIWKCKIRQGTETNPSIADDGTIYVGSPDGHLYAIYPNGTLKWSFKVIGNIHQSSPAISADGTIYFGTDDSGYIYAVNHDGTEKWKKKIAKNWVESSPSIAEDGTIYIGSSYDMGIGYLHAFGNVESNIPPEKPSITSEPTWRMGVKYRLSIISIDLDNNPVSFYIDWGDGTITNWTMDRASGETCYYEHIWDKWGTYTIKAKAKDTFGLESDWTEFQIKINIPRTRAWLRFLDIFPILQRMLDFIN